MKYRTSGRLLWRASHAQTCWMALRLGTSWALGATFRPSDLMSWLKTVHAVPEEHLSWILLRDAKADGKVQALGNGWYRDTAGLD